MQVDLQKAHKMIPPKKSFKNFFLPLGFFLVLPLLAFLPFINEKKFFLVEEELLKRIKHSNRSGIQKGKIPEIQRLLEVADQKLLEGPYSVTHKKQLPPSGDIHDYTSMGPYWWPDPEKEDGLPYIRRDGEINPEYYDYRDREDFGKLMSALKALGEAYYFVEKEEYATHAVNLIRAWFLEPETRMNPNLNFAQRIPGVTEGRGIGIIDTRRLAELPDIISMLSASSSWKETDEKDIKAWLGDYVDWLIHSGHGKDEAIHGNNHTTWYFAQVVPLALYLGRMEQADSLAKAGLPLILEKMIAGDGSQPLELARTRSWDYSAMNLVGMFTFAKASEHVGMNVWEMQNDKGVGLRDALDFMIPYAKEEKDWEYEQIMDLDFEKLKSSLNIAAFKYQDKKYRKMAKHLNSGKGDFDYWDLANFKTMKK